MMKPLQWLLSSSQLSPEVSRVVYSFPAKLLKEKLVSLVKAHFHLATTVITGIPMKVWSALIRILSNNSFCYDDRRNKSVVVQQIMTWSYCIMLTCTVMLWGQVCHYYYHILWLCHTHTHQHINNMLGNHLSDCLENFKICPIGFQSATATTPVAINAVVSLKWATPRSSSLGRWLATLIHFQ